VQALRYDEALEDADSALAIDASFPKAFWRKGEALAALKRYPEALKAYKAGCAL
jgi:tetratricopeptide (TPR) repeat protein